MISLFANAPLLKDINMVTLRHRSQTVGHHQSATLTDGLLQTGNGYFGGTVAIDGSKAIIKQEKWNICGQCPS